MITIVIPTLQKRLDVLEKLIESLNNDPCVGEIIVIDNAVRGFNFNYEKMKVITPNSNIYVNPAWNLGTKEAKYDIVGLLNDDIIIPDDICSKIMQQFNDNQDIGALAFHLDDIKPIENIKEAPQNSEFTLEKANFVAGGYGMALFYRKKLYKPIPETMKIWFGDNFIFKQIQKTGYINYWIRGQEVYHLGSLSCGEFKAGPLYKADKKAWNKIKYKWYQHIFMLEEYNDCIKIKLFGLNIRIYNKKTEDKILNF